MAAGLFVGALPLFGLHLPLCLAVAWPLRLDSLVAYGAANISNPVIAPLLLAAEYQVGSLVLRGVPSAFDGATFRALGLGGVVAQAAVGAMVVGAAMALLGGSAAAWLTKKVGSRVRSARPAFARTIRRYRRLPLRQRLYVALKLRFDPLYPELLASGHAFGEVLDAGCGRAQLALYLKDTGLAEGIRGFDSDTAKVDVARTAARAAGEFWRQSLVDERPWPTVDTVLLVDVLHYLPEAEHEPVLERARAALEPGGRLLLREIDAGQRSGLGRLAEGLGVTLGMNRGVGLHFLPQTRVREWLDARGFTVTTLVASERSTLSNFVLVAERTD